MTKSSDALQLPTCSSVLQYTQLVRVMSKVCIANDYSETHLTCTNTLTTPTQLEQDVRIDIPAVSHTNTEPHMQFMGVPQVANAE